MAEATARARRSAGRGFRRRLLTVTAASALVAVGVASVPAVGAAPHRAAAPAKAGSITYTRATVVVPTKTVRSQLLSVSRNGAVFTFRSRQGALRRLKAKSVMLLPGLAVRDVTKVARSGRRFVVTTKAARITDLISHGTLSWNKSINFAKGFALGGSAVPVEKTARTASLASRFGLTPMAGSGGITLKGKTKSYGYSVNFKSAGGAVHVTITISKSSPVEVEAKIIGTLDNVSSAGKISINKGKLVAAKMLANNLKGSFTLAYSAKPISAFGLGQAGGIKITLPAELTVPFTVGIVPMFLGVKVAFFASAGFSGFDQSLSGSWTLKYDGHGGFSTSSSGATSPSGVAKGLAKIALGAANAVDKGPLSFVFGAQMPQLELGMGVKGLNVAGNVTFIGSTGIATYGAGCDTRQMEIEGVAGADANFFGFSTNLGSAKLFDKKIQAAWPKGCGTFPN